MRGVWSLASVLGVGRVLLAIALYVYLSEDLALFGPSSGHIPHPTAHETIPRVTQLMDVCQVIIAVCDRKLSFDGARWRREKSLSFDGH